MQKKERNSSIVMLNKVKISTSNDEKHLFEQKRQPYLLYPVTVELLPVV